MFLLLISVYSLLLQSMWLYDFDLIIGPTQK
jgi:hypothetical protein